MFLSMDFYGVIILRDIILNDKQKCYCNRRCTITFPVTSELITSYIFRYASGKYNLFIRSFSSCKFLQPVNIVQCFFLVKKPENI